MSFSSARPGFLRRVSNRLALLTAEGATVEDMEFEEVSEPSIDRTSELEQKKDVFAAWQIEAAAVDLEGLIGIAGEHAGLEHLQTGDGEAFAAHVHLAALLGLVLPLGAGAGVEQDADEEEVDELESSPPRGKRKRALAKAPARPAKRVAFAPEPKGTKQARSAAGAKSAAASKVKAKADKLAPKAAKKPVKAAAKAAPKTAAPPKKVANAVSSKKSAASAAKDGEVAYNFKQFF